MIQTLWKMVWRFLKKLGIKPPYDPAIPLLGIYPEETKTEKDTHTPLLAAALFTTAGAWKRPTCPSAEERVQKPRHRCTTGYSSAMKRDTLESGLMRWTDPE